LITVEKRDNFTQKLEMSPENDEDRSVRELKKPPFLFPKSNTNPPIAYYPSPPDEFL